jgi:hypothetical protein
MKADVLCRETEAQGPEKVELGALAAAVISAREGLTPLSFDEYVAIAADLGVKALDGALPAPSDDAAAGDSQLVAAQASVGPAWAGHPSPCSSGSLEWHCKGAGSVSAPLFNTASPLVSPDCRGQQES